MKVGKITSVNYNQFRVKVSSEIRGNSVNLNGTVYYFGNIGSYLKTTNAVGETLVCEVISIFDNDLHYEKQAFDVDGNKELMLKPIGTITRDRDFNLGVGIFPGIYSDVSIVTFEDMERILKTVSKSTSKDEIHQSFSLGISKNLINYPIDISIDRFFNIHSAVLGNSGSGKSNTIAHIIQNIHKKKSHSATGSRILIFDVNGEYKNAFINHNASPEINVKLYKPNIEKETEGVKPFFLPHFLMSLDEWSAFLMATEATQRPFWDRVLQESYRFYKIATSRDQDKLIFINYLRYKICSLIFNILNQADTDTSNITAASSVIASIRAIIDENPELKSSCVSANLYQDLVDLQSHCLLSYGQNNGRLKEAVTMVYEKVDQENFTKVMNFRLAHGEYFDYKFLRIAVNLALLEEDARGNRRMREYTSTMLNRLDYFLDNPDCEFMRNSPSGVKNSTSYLNYIWDFNGDKTSKTQMVIVDTSELSPDALETLTAVVSRLIFSERKTLQNDDRRKNPVHLVLDEAHRYIKKDYQYILKENIFEKIAREGRKYSLYLLVSSQRPSELSETVLSQCANFIIHRIQNEIDMRYVYAILPYFSDDFANKIKQSVPGEALVFGNCVSMPLHVKIYKACPEPNSKNCIIPEEWFKSSVAIDKTNT